MGGVMGDIHGINGMLVDTCWELNMAGWEISQQTIEVCSWERHGPRWAERKIQYV